MIASQSLRIRPGCPLPGETDIVLISYSTNFTDRITMWPGPAIIDHHSGLPTKFHVLEYLKTCQECRVQDDGYGFLRRLRFLTRFLIPFESPDCRDKTYSTLNGVFLVACSK